MGLLRYRRLDWTVDISATAHGARLAFEDRGQAAAAGAPTSWSPDVELDRNALGEWERGVPPAAVVEQIELAFSHGVIADVPLSTDVEESDLRRMAVRTDLEMAGRPWEDMLRAAFPYLMVCRVSPVPPSGVDLPFGLPLRLLEIGASGRTGQAGDVDQSLDAGGDPVTVAEMLASHAAVARPLDDPVAEALVRVAQVPPGELDSWRAEARWPSIDVVHVHVGEPGPWWLSTAHPDEPATLGWLRRLVLTAATRLVVLECAGDDAVPARQLAAALVGAGGPAVVVAPRGANLADFYGFLVAYDRPVDDAAHVARLFRHQSPSLSVFGGAGREELVRVSRVAEQLLDLADAAPEVGGPAELDDVAGRASNAAGRSDIVSAIEEVLRPEVGRWQLHMPGAGGTTQVGDSVAKIRALVGVDAPTVRPPSDEPRFVRSSLRGLDAAGRPGAEVERRAEPLEVGQPYVLAVDVGPRAERPSLRAAALLEEVMGWQPGDDGRFVEVGVTGLDFDVTGSLVQLLWVPRSAPSDTVYFVVTPRRSGAAALRFSVYVDDRVVQSFLVGALTRPPGAGGDAGSAGDRDRRLLARLLRVGDDEVDATWHSRMEFAMAGADDGLFAERGGGVSLVVNDREGEAVVTVKAGDAFSVTVSNDLPGMVADIRAALAAISTPPRPGVLPEHLRYAFSTDDQSLNAGDDQALAAALLRLAPLGWRLFDHLFAAGDRPLLAERTAANDAEIRVAHLLLEKVLPWAALYDRDYDEDRKTVSGTPVEHTACLAALPAADGSLPDVACGELAACALHLSNLPPGLGEGDRQTYAQVVACPLHFWGFRHRIELPPGQVNEDPEGGDAVEPPVAGGAGVPDQVRAASPPRLGVGSHAGLRRYEDHLRDIAQLVAPAWTVFDADEVKDRLAGDLDLDLVYLYCHAEGGQDSGVDPPVLRFRPAGGVEGEVRAENLGASPWPHHPFVVINGCHTAGFRHDALSPFIRKLTRDRRAAGVLGTEISVWEELAVEVGLGFLAGLLGDLDAGAALLATRRRLLAKRNPLGLAYTLYARSSLRLLPGA